MAGAASDIALPNHDPGAFEQAAREADVLGSGFYPRSDFMHIDLGPGGHGRGAARSTIAPMPREQVRTSFHIAWRSIVRHRRRDDGTSVHVGREGSERARTFAITGMRGMTAPNMPIRHQLRIVFGEMPIDAAGKRPTPVFRVGPLGDVCPIGLVNRRADDDGD